MRYKIFLVIASLLLNAITFLLFFPFFLNFRYNTRGFDLNRNFPDYFKPHTKREQPETEAVREWLSKIQFVLSGSLHGGALVSAIQSLFYQFINKL